MLISKLLVILLIPLVILSLGLWLFSVSEANRTRVEVAGALLGFADVEASVTECYLHVNEGARVLTVTLEARNRGEMEVSINPYLFQIVLAKRTELPEVSSLQTYFKPMRFTTLCPEAEQSISRIPPGATRTITFQFLAQNMPRGDDWDNYVLSLEYYDPDSEMALSKLLIPEER